MKTTRLAVRSRIRRQALAIKTKNDGDGLRRSERNVFECSFISSGPALDYMVSSDNKRRRIVEKSGRSINGQSTV